MPAIFQQQNDVNLSKYEVTGRGLSIGRSANNDIYLDDPSVSQFHANIEVKELKNGNSIYFINDLKSTNKTKVNGQIVEQHLLNDQDIIEIGLNQFKYVDEDTESLAATQAFRKSWLPGVKVLR